MESTSNSKSGNTLSDEVYEIFYTEINLKTFEVQRDKTLTNYCYNKYLEEVGLNDTHTVAFAETLGSQEKCDRILWYYLKQLKDKINDALIALENTS
jgi:hypothetical protein